MPVDKYDRNATLWAHERSGFKSGWQRGREVYFMNCWMCHSEYVIAGDWAPVPTLRDVTKRLTDAQITTYIQNGAGRMPAFKQLTDADIKDLLALFHEKCGTFPTGGGCFDEHNPPPNPLYEFGTEYLAPQGSRRSEVNFLEARRCERRADRRNVAGLCAFVMCLALLPAWVSRAIDSAILDRSGHGLIRRGAAGRDSGRGEPGVDRESAHRR